MPPEVPAKFYLSDYDFDLPASLIAQSPLARRDDSRLMVVDRSRGTISHRRFAEIGEFLKPHDLLVANNTRVLNARLIGRRILSAMGGELTLGGRVEFLMLSRPDPQGEPTVWEGLFHASGKATPGFKFQIPTPEGKAIVGEVVRGFGGERNRTLRARFDRDPVEAGAGEIPLPPYIERTEQDPRRLADQERYQTVYSDLKQRNSAAAPTAGLHFTPELIASLQAKGIDWAELTLEVGVGTFRPVQTEDIREHEMHQERYEISPETVTQIQKCKQTGNRVIAIGTTTVRTLEGSRLIPGMGATSIYIYPGYSFKVIDGMITNFHLPKSTLLVMVSAFAGYALIHEAYRQAVAEKYRFFSYGDAMLIV